MSNMQRTIRELKIIGGRYAIAEHWQAYASRKNGQFGIRKDLFGFVDIVYLPLQGPVTAIQVCGSDFMPHVKKMRTTAIVDALAWLSCGGRVEIWAWRKILKKKGSKVKIWQPRIVSVTADWLIEDFF